MDIHVTPVGDFREHKESRDCWCNPEHDEDDCSIWIHKSMDGREAFETGERLPS